MYIFRTYMYLYSLIILPQPSIVLSDIAFTATYEVEVVLYEAPQYKATLTFFTPQCDRPKPHFPAQCMSDTEPGVKVINKTTTVAPLTTTNGKT